MATIKFGTMFCLE